MKKARCFKLAPNKAQQGFTLVELITVIILLGVLAIAVAPRFTDRSGYSEFALQQRLLGALRNTQLKAMHDTRNDFCYRIVLDTTAADAHQFGPASASYLDGQQANSCDVSIDFASESYLRSEPSEVSEAGLQMRSRDGSAAINFLQFDNLGRPTSSGGTCLNNCTVTFSGESDAQVCIASEGYIYAC